MSGEKKQTECLHPGDYRVCVLLGTQRMPAEGTGIRKSRFAYCLYTEGMFLLFHILTRKLLVIAPEYADAFADGRILPASVLEDETLGRLYADYFLVPEHTDESKLYLEVKNILTVKEELPKGITHYVILPTTTCNARCFYCFEQGMQYRKMSRETVNDVLRFIREHKPEEQKKIHIHWFGGEPMCAADNIDRICEGLDEAGIEYSAEMTSNGSLFDEKSAKQAKEKWKVEEIQITLDGTAEEYARRKQYAGKIDKPFETVIRNMHLLISAGIKVTVRLNTDENNIEEIYRVADFLKEEFSGEEREKMRVYAHSLFGQEGEGLDACPAGGAPDALEEKVLEINNHLVRLGLIRKDLSGLLTLKNHYCMVTAPECNVLIDSSGTLFACDAMPENMRYGDVKTGIDPESWRRVAEPCGIRPECSECVFLPQCTEFDRCPNRMAYDDCFRQEKRNLENELRFALEIWKDRKEASRVSD